MGCGCCSCCSCACGCRWRSRPSMRSIRSTPGARSGASWCCFSPVRTWRWRCGGRVDLQRLLVGVSIVCVFWSVDASWQFIHGFNLLGYPYEGGRVPGIFHPDLKLGIVLVTVSPFVFEAMRRLAGRCAWVLLALIPFFAAIALSGSRSSWIVLLVVMGGYGWYLFRWIEAPVRGRAVLRVAAVGVLACGILAGSFPQAAGQMQGLLDERVAPVVDFIKDDFQVSESTSVPLHARLTSWESAARVFRNHWLNGVGPRGFKKVHPDNAPAHDVLVRQGRTSNYPHLVVFEIAAETGAIGLLGYLARACGAGAQVPGHGPHEACPWISLFAGQRRRPASIRYALGILLPLHGRAHLVDDCSIRIRSLRVGPVRTGRRDGLIAALVRWMRNRCQARKPRRCCRCCRRWEVGGAERGTVDVTAGLAGAGWHAVVASSGGAMTVEVERAGGIHVTLPLDRKNPWTIWRNVRVLQDVVREHRVDIVHARSRAPAWSACAAARRSGVPFMTTFHGVYGCGNRLKKAYNSIMTKGDVVIAVSEFVSRHCPGNVPGSAETAAGHPSGNRYRRLQSGCGLGRAHGQARPAMASTRQRAGHHAAGARGPVERP